MERENEIIALPIPVQHNLIALRTERERIQQAISLIISTAINMAGGSPDAEYQLSEDCTHLVKVIHND